MEKIDFFQEPEKKTGHINTLEPRCNEGPRDLQNLFKVLLYQGFFSFFFYYWGKENHSLY